MKTIWKICFRSILITAMLSCGFARAQTDSTKPPASKEFFAENTFRKGRFETTLWAGSLFSPVGNPKHRNTLNYALGSFQLGYMLNDPGDGGFFRGNFELAPEAFGAAIHDGRGNYIAGGAVWLRYNFVPHGWRVIPYAQLGAGVELTDADRSLLGQNFNFNLDAAAGLRYFIAPRCTLNLEGRFQHLSNANLARKNVGINAVGPILGVSWFF
jgi:lipid A 3-O-deacylase